MSLEERVRRLEDRHEIAELRYEYCYRVDAFDYEGFTALFTDDARIEFGPAGVYEGRNGVRGFVETVVGGEYDFLSHMVHNPIIDVDGDTATGQWYFEVPYVASGGDTDGWIQGRYDEQYRRVDGTWRFAEIVADFNYITDYQDGWADIVSKHR